VIAAVCVAIAFALDRTWTTPSFVPEAVRPFGFALVGAGVALAVWGLVAFHRRHTTHDPFGTATTLVTGGPYRFTRNPMYVGVTSVLLGIAAWRGTLAWAFAPAAFFAYVASFQVPFEERRLAGWFGAEYADYRGRVRRWV
jgi:protein-S-isoprenylcysteine O-methyltransferase Ste14